MASVRKGSSGLSPGGWQAIQLIGFVAVTVGVLMGAKAEIADFKQVVSGKLVELGHNIQLIQRDVEQAGRKIDSLSSESVKASEVQQWVNEHSRWLDEFFALNPTLVRPKQSIPQIRR